MDGQEAIGAPCAPGRRRIPAQVWDAAVEARRLRGAAAAEASALRAQAAADVEAIRSGAAARGREEGLAAVAETLARAAVERDRLLAASEPELVELALAIAARVLERVAERDRAMVVEVAARALERVRSCVDVTVRAHPADVAALRESEPRLVQLLSRARRLAIVEDAAIARGGVLLDTEVGSIDARLATQLEALRVALEAARP